MDDFVLLGLAEHQCAPDRPHHRATQPLSHARQCEQGQAAGGAAGHRGERKHDDRRREHAASAQSV
jgi:hypothetical protein